MRNFTRIFLSGLSLGFTSDVEKKKFDLPTVDDSQKGPPGIKPFDLTWLKASNRNIYKLLNQSVC